MELFISSEMKEHSTLITKAPWSGYVKYLKVKLVDSMDACTLIEFSLKQVINKVHGQLEERQKLCLSWFGSTATLKVKEGAP